MLVFMSELKNGIPQVSVQDLSAMLKAGMKNKILVDVRGADERAVCLIEGASHVPLNDILSGAAALDPDQEYVIHCKAGGRSQKAAEHLASLGFTKVSNVAGGILAWIDAVDPTLQKY